MKNCLPREGSRHFHANLNVLEKPKKFFFCGPPHPGVKTAAITMITDIKIAAIKLLDSWVVIPFFSIIYIYLSFSFLSLNIFYVTFYTATEMNQNGCMTSFILNESASYTYNSHSGFFHSNSPLGYIMRNLSYPASEVGHNRRKG